MLEGNAESQIEQIYDYLSKFNDSFANSVGEAIDPLQQNGDGALDIVEVPGDIEYTSGASLSVDGTLFGHIDVEFTLPQFAVGGVIQYRQEDTINFTTVYPNVSPWRISGLQIGQVYQVQMAGIAANGFIGPFSELEDVEIPTSLLDTAVPDNFQVTPIYSGNLLTWEAGVGGIALEYEIERAEDALFLVNIETWTVDATRFVDSGVIGVEYYYRVRSINKAGGFSDWSDVESGETLNVPDESIGTYQLSDLTNTTQAISLTGTGALGELLVQDVVVTHNLNKVVQVTPSLEGTANEVDTARFTGVFLIANGVNSFTVRVVGLFLASIVEITGTLHSRYR